MAYETPKAIHFDAYRDGEKLPSTNTDGLRSRWRAASICSNMLKDGWKYGRDMLEQSAETASNDSITVKVADPISSLLVP